MSGRLRVTLGDFLHVREERGAHRVALRAGISVLVPLLTVVALGRPEWSPYAAFGAFTSLYGRNHVHLSRAVMQLSAGAALTVSVVLGVLVGCLDSRAWAGVAGAALVAAAGSAVASAQDWHPPGPLFLVFAFGAAASVPHVPSDVPVAALVAGAGALFAVFVGNVGGYARRQRSRPARLSWRWTWEPLRFAVAALVAGGVATASGIGHPYWAAVAAVAPLSAPDAAARVVRAGNRIIGTLFGLATSAALLALPLSPLVTVLVVAALQVVAELLVGRHYGLALLFITPIALLMGQIAAPRPTGELLFDRGVETVIGACVGMAIVLLAERARHRRDPADPRPA
jgi:hypothetical protein